jgi:hypothetical protein
MAAAASGMPRPNLYNLVLCEPERMRSQKSHVYKRTAYTAFNNARRRLQPFVSRDATGMLLIERHETVPFVQA